MQEIEDAALGAAVKRYGELLRAERTRARNALWDVENEEFDDLQDYEDKMAGLLYYVSYTEERVVEYDKLVASILSKA